MFYLTVGWDLAFTAGEVDVVPTRYSLLYCVPQLCPSNLKFLATPLHGVGVITNHLDRKDVYINDRTLQRGDEAAEKCSLALPDPRRQPVIAYSMNARRGSGNARLGEMYAVIQQKCSMGP